RTVARGHLPRPDPLAAADEDGPAVGAHGYRPQRFLVLEGGTQPPGRGRLPEADGSVRAARQGDLAVATKSHGIDPTNVAQVADGPGRCRFPQPGLPVMGPD